MRIYFLFILISLIPCSLYGCNGEVQLLHSVSGEVGGGNYTYYNLMYTGPISLHLHTSEGDADLYVSQVVTKPTFDLDNYCLHSSTCGVDTVDIPISFKRPVSIGVYGHPSHYKSVYLLEVLYRDGPDDTNIYNKLNYKESYTDIDDSNSSETDRDDQFNSPDKEEEIESVLGTILWTFVNILLEILFL